MSNETTTLPAAIVILSGETLPISIDFSTLITAGQVPTLPTAILTDVDTGAVIVLSTTPTLSGNVVTQTVTALTPAHRYRLVVGLTALPGIVWQSGTIINCPF